jgi:hypothetical protein
MPRIEQMCGGMCSAAGAAGLAAQAVQRYTAIRPAASATFATLLPPTDPRRSGIGWVGRGHL